MAKKAIKKPASTKVDPNIEEEYYEDYTFICPKRGKVTQKVKVKKLKTKQLNETPVVIGQQDVIDKLEEKESDSIYGSDESEKADDVD